MADDSVDTSLLNNGIIFCQNPVDGELDYYWDNEAEICCPSLMPDNNVIIEQFSGDSMDLEEKCFQNMANLLNKRDHDNVARNELLSYKEKRDGPVLSEEEEDTEEGGIHRLEHDPVFQDEAGLMYGDDSRGEIWPDDEGMDPMENQ
ncbi:5741_t:CDS:2 [Rhizophagus irregularis]|nr:5741_t:CDS:2 [Rhizophagus irregularis]